MATDHAQNLPELHAFLKRYGHTEQHKDEHILKAVKDVPSLMGAKRALGSHPAFFRHDGTPMAPGAHVFTGWKPGDPAHVSPKPATPAAKAAVPSAPAVDHAQHIGEYHAFLKRYGHDVQHKDEHVLKVVKDANTVMGAKRALGQHPAFFQDGKAVTPGEHRFTGKALDKPATSPEHDAAKAAAPGHVGSTAQAKHREAANKIEKQMERVPGTDASQRLIIQAGMSSANAHRFSSSAAKTHTEAAHTTAASKHEAASKLQAAVGNRGAADVHAGHAVAHKAAAAAIGEYKKASGWAAWRASMKKTA